MKIELQDVCFTYSNQKDLSASLFNNLNIKENVGSFLSIIGPSGCGKSTLIKLLLGVLEQHSGRVLIDDNQPSNLINEHKFSACFQDPSLLPWRNVEDNLMLPGDIRRRNTDHELLDNILQNFGLSTFKHYFPHQLSGGMKQRVALARALIADCKYLFLDEPFSQLDEILRMKLLLFVHDFCSRNGIKVVLITHDISEAVLMSDCIAVMRPAPSQSIDFEFVEHNAPRTFEFTRTDYFHRKVDKLREMINTHQGHGALDEL